MGICRGIANLALLHRGKCRIQASTRNCPYKNKMKDKNKERRIQRRDTPLFFFRPLFAFYLTQTSVSHTRRKSPRAKEIKKKKNQFARKKENLAHRQRKPEPEAVLVTRHDRAGLEGGE